MACKVNGKLVRLPFDNGFSEKVIGIFQNKRSNIFLYVKIKDELNDALISIGFQELEGCYYARSSYIPTGNWIVSFKEGCDTLKTDYFGSAATAKIRYFGKFE